MSSRFDAEDQDLTITSRRQGEAYVVETRGEVTVFTSPDLREALGRIAEGGCGIVVVDLSGTAYVDSSGVATFVEALRTIRDRGGEMRLAGISDRVRGVFEIARLDTVFAMYGTVEEALAP